MSEPTLYCKAFEKVEGGYAAWCCVYVGTGKSGNAVAILAPTKERLIKECPMADPELFQRVVIVRDKRFPIVSPKEVAQ